MSDEKIIQFPSAEARNLADFQRILREYIKDDDVSQFVYERLGNLWISETERTLGIHVDESMIPVVNELRNFFRESTNKLFMELVHANIEIYMATHR